ncbi:MAG: putative glycolipid-binding domain-containing protein [Pseudomonadota bacterium]
MNSDPNRILWTRVDVSGHDACRIRQTDGGWNLTGSAVASEAGSVITALSYQIDHDAGWVTRSAQVSGFAGSQDIDLTILRSGDGNWTVNGAPVQSVQGCVDIDLGFTPATNTTAIRRAKLDVGGRASGIAAWLDDADWTLKPLEQSYLRRSGETYTYASPGHDFTTDLSVNESGLVTEYPGFWVHLV